ncbi:MAG: acetate/propionate family kinase [Gammaproteobacteria bacterium]|jgi:acetate kinase
MNILAVNTGSTSCKLDLYHVDRQAKYHVRSYHDSPQQISPEDAFKAIVSDTRELDAVVHRVVHGGRELVASCLIDNDIESKIEQLSQLAPLHNPIAVQWIRASRRYLNKPQVAVFDTAYFANLPGTASNYALPRQITDELGVRRYGFHGIAHQAMWQRWCSLRPDLTQGGRLISIQLGGGCSITANMSGSPLDTSMGFSPAEGLVMATRTGDIDPGVIIQLFRERNMTAESVERMINEQSGLLGLSGKSADMRDIIDDPQPQSRLAVEAYCYRVRKYIGAYLAVLEGADGIVFGGGVGEHMPEVRSHILSPMAWCGIHIDHETNANATGKEARISVPDSTIDVRVIPVDEAAILIDEARAVLSN